jgi:hypothetical protein
MSTANINTLTLPSLQLVKRFQLPHWKPDLLCSARQSGSTGWTLYSAGYGRSTVSESLCRGLEK